MATSALFQRFVDDELASTPAFVARVVAGTVQLLGPARDSPLSASDRAHHAELVVALQRDAARYERAFAESLRRLVADELHDSARSAAQAEPKPGLDSLELMDESLVEVDIEISRAMQLIDSTAEWELRELQTYTSSLLGQKHVTAESNPFRPVVYATALWEAACALVDRPVQRVIVLRTSAGVAAGLLKNAWAAATTRLEAQGVEPGVYRTVVLPSGASPHRPGAEPARAGALSALLPAMAQADSSSASSASAMPAGSRAAAATPSRPHGLRDGSAQARSPELEQALLRLDELLRHLPAETSLAGRAAPSGARLAQHRSALLASASEPLDRQVIELVTRLFEALAADSQLPAAFRAVLSRLQIAVLRVCLLERAMLDDDAHPTWQLLDRIGEAAVGYSRSEDARLAAFQVFAGAVAEEMAGSAAPDTALFRRGLNRIESFLAEQLQAQLRGAHAAVDALQRAERREVLQQHLSRRLVDQMVPVRTTPAIRRFVTGTWAQVIAETMLRHGEQSEPTLTSLKTVDDLLWSLKIPDHPQSRQRLIALLPGLLQRVRAGMETVSLAAAERQAVLNELMAVHTEALRPGARVAGASGVLTPEEIVQRMRDEVLTDAPARSFSDSVIDLSSMETVPVEHLPTGGDRGGDRVGDPADDRGHDDPAQRVEALRTGMRQRIFLQGRWHRVQLLWRSDRSLFFLFAGESPARTHSITRRALERLSWAGLVQPLETKALVARAVDRMIRDMSARS